MKIAILVGHGKSLNGGYDPGACSNGLEEFKIAREVANAANAAMKDYSNVTCSLINYDGKTNLNERITLVNKNAYDFIAEIHLNAFSNSSAKGTETWYYTGDAEGRKVADLISKSLSKALNTAQRSNGVDDGGDKHTPNAFGIVCRTRPTAVLVETLFITNTEVQKITSTAGQKKAGIAIAEGIAAAYGLKKATVAPPANKPMYSIHVEHFNTREAAEAAKAKIDQLGYYNYITIDENGKK